MNAQWLYYRTFVLCQQLDIAMGADLVARHHELVKEPLVQAMKEAAEQVRAEFAPFLKTMHSVLRHADEDADDGDERALARDLLQECERLQKVLAEPLAMNSASGATLVICGTVSWTPPPKPEGAQCTECSVDQPYPPTIQDAGVKCRGCGRVRPNVRYVLAPEA